MQITFDADRNICTPPRTGDYAGWSIEEIYYVHDADGYLEQFRSLDDAFHYIENCDDPNEDFEIIHQWTTCAHGRDGDYYGESDDAEFETFQEALKHVNAMIDEFNNR